MKIRNTTAPRRGWWAVVLCIFGAGFVGIPSALAQETWTVLPFETRGIEPHIAETFVDLLEVELGARESLQFIEPGVEGGCSDLLCAQEAGHSVDAMVAIFGSLSTLGTEIIVTATVINVPTGNTLCTQRMTVNRVEELDTVASRVAEAIISGSSVEETADLGSITSQEAEPDVRREGDAGFGFRLGGIFPFADGYAEAGGGILIDLAFWYEARHFAIGPSSGIRFSVDSGEASYLEVPINVSGFYIPNTGDIAALLGGGVGVRYINESRPAIFTTGSFLQTQLDTVLDDSGWGLGLLGQAGVLFLRTWAVRLAVTVDYNITFLELNGVDYPQSLTFGLMMIL